MNLIAAARPRPMGFQSSKRPWSLLAQPLKGPVTERNAGGSYNARMICRLVAIFLIAAPAIHAQTLDSSGVVPRFELGERSPVQRLCRHPSGDQRVALALPGTVWMQRDTGPRAVVYQLPMDIAEMEAILDSMRDDFAVLGELQDRAVESSVSVGEGGERCELRVFDHGEVITVHYSGLDTLSPALAHVDRTLDRMAGRVLETPIATWDLGELEIGDLLRRRADGVLFEYYGPTGDGLGAELHGVRQPLVVLEVSDELPRLYDRLGSAVTRSDGYDG